MRAALLVLFALLASLAALHAADAPPSVFGVAGNLALETNALMKMAVHAARKSPPKGWRTQTGKMGVKAKWEAGRSSPWFNEDQQNWTTRV